MSHACGTPSKSPGNLPVPCVTLSKSPRNLLTRVGRFPSLPETFPHVWNAFQVSRKPSHACERVSKSTGNRPTRVGDFPDRPVRLIFGCYGYKYNIFISKMQKIGDNYFLLLIFCSFVSFPAH